MKKRQQKGKCMVQCVHLESKLEIHLVSKVITWRFELMLNSSNNYP